MVLGWPSYSTDFTAVRLQHMSVSWYALQLNSVHARSVVELPVLILSKECDPDGRQSVRLEQPQTFLESVVDINAPAGTDNDSTTSPTNS